MTSYTVITQESNGDLGVLSQSGYQLQVAKSVTDTSGTTSFNVVYQSHELAPNMSIHWNTNYALNWTTNIPTPGATVTYGGNWQPCTAGQSWDIDSTGSWQPNQNNPNAKGNCLNVGKNGYEEDVYIIVGVQDGSGQYAAIWVSPSKLLKQSSGEYEPLETVTLWYEEGTQTSAMVSNQETQRVQRALGLDESRVFFSYSTTQGKWLEQNTPFTFTF